MCRAYFDRSFQRKIELFNLNLNLVGRTFDRSFQHKTVQSRSRRAGQGVMASRDAERRMIQESTGEGEGEGSSSQAVAPCTNSTKNKRFEIKKWNAVALWAWGIMRFQPYLLHLFIYSKQSRFTPVFKLSLTQESFSLKISNLT